LNNKERGRKLKTNIPVKKKNDIISNDVHTPNDVDKTKQYNFVKKKSFPEIVKFLREMNTW